MGPWAVSRQDVPAYQNCMVILTGFITCTWIWWSVGVYNDWAGQVVGMYLPDQHLHKTPHHTHTLGFLVPRCYVNMSIHGDLTSGDEQVLRPSGGIVKMMCESPIPTPSMLTFLLLLLCCIISEYKLLESFESLVNQFLTVVNMILA